MSTATKTEPRFIRIRIEDFAMPAELRFTELVVDRWSRQDVDAGDVGFHETFYRAYSRPTFCKWSVGMFGSQHVLADAEWLCGLYRISGPVKPHETVEGGRWSLSSRMTAKSQPSMFGLVCSAFGIENPATD